MHNDSRLPATHVSQTDIAAKKSNLSATKTDQQTEITDQTEKVVSNEPLVPKGSVLGSRLNETVAKSSRHEDHNPPSHLAVPKPTIRNVVHDFSEGKGMNEADKPTLNDPDKTLVTNEPLFAETGP